MHLKLDPAAAIDHGEIARDLGQASADIVVLSAVDTELAACAAALAKHPFRQGVKAQKGIELRCWVLSRAQRSTKRNACRRLAIQ